MARQATALIVLFSFLFGNSAIAEDYWPGWLGPKRNGWVEYFEPPSAWPEELKKNWQVDVGEGYASPLVANGLVFQYARQGENDVLFCLDLNSGETKWKKSYSVPFKMGGGGEWHGKGPKAAPILADGRVFTLSISGILSAWNAESGNLLWRRDYNERFDKDTPYWGATTSPIVDGDKVFAHFGNDKKGVLAALNVATGEEAWTLDKDAPSYSSPLIEEVGGVRQLIEWNHRALVGVDVANGNQLWEYPFEHVGTNQNMPTPSFHDGRILIGGENRGVRSVQPSLQRSQWTVKENWHQPKVALDMSSAVVNDGLMYGFSHLSAGRIFCLDPKTGDIVWQGPPRVGANVTFLTIPKSTIALLDKGELQVIAATRDGYERVASWQVADKPTWAPPVLLKDGLLIKDRDSLIRWSFP